MYDPPLGDDISVDLNQPIQIDGANIIIDFALDAPSYVPPVVNPALSPGIQIPWGVGRSVMVTIESSWGYASKLNVSVRCGYKNGMALCVELESGWKGITELYKNNRIAWNRLCNSDIRLRSAWNNLATKNKEKDLPWSNGDSLGDEVEVPWSNPPEKNTEIDIAYNRLTELGADVDVPWKQLLSKNKHHRTLWGRKHYERICARDYEVPDGGNIEINLDVPITSVGDGDHIDIWFEHLSYDERCSQDEPSGWRESYTFRPPTKFPYPRTPIKDLWIVMNSVSLTRVSDSKPLAATDITVNSDLGSWCWGFDATINKLDSYLAICPDGTSNAIVRATMNGRNWLARIERASETVAFGKPAWRVSGRSLSSELAAPAAAAASYFESSDRTAVQLMEEALDGTGWTLVMESVDWLVTGGSLSVENETPLQVVQRIAASAGAVVQSDRESKTLRVVPRYKGNPWSWTDATPDLSIDESVVRSFSPEWVPGVQYNGVYVSGTNQGVLARVIRSGSAGDVLAPMVTDALCTATEVALERGRNVLAASGPWQTISIDLPMMPGTDLPGLLIPGSLIEVTQGARGTWRAQVVSTRIRGTWNNGCSVRQVLGVERYFGD